MKRQIMILPALSVLLLLSVSRYAFGLDNNFREKIYSLKWIAYAPVNFNPDRGQYPSSASVKEDLKLLLNCGFNGLITYGAAEKLSQVPQIAKGLGFQGVIMGIWDIQDQTELDNAIRAAQYVDGYCVGNEGLSVRYELEDLNKVINYIKKKTNLPATTTEQVTDYANQTVLEIGDWVFPNVHPFLCNIKSPPKAVNWIKKYYYILSRNARAIGKPVLFKEIGYPTGGEPLCSENNQKVFFSLMETTDVNFAYFEAFDQYWKQHLSVEPHWGLFNRHRRPKRFISDKLKKDNADKKDYRDNLQ